MGKTNQLGVLADVFTSDASNNVGIGGSPSGSYKLEVTGTAKVSTSAYFAISSGSVGIGTISPASVLEVAGAPVAGDALTGIIQTLTNNSTAYNASPQSGIAFQYKYNTGGSIVTGGGLAGLKENATTGDYATALAFYTRANGGNITERMRITSGGNVSIGNTQGNSTFTVSESVSGNPTRELNVNTSTAGVIRLFAYNRNAGGIPLVLNDPGGNVLIGTTTDYGYKLGINGTNALYITGGSTVSHATIVAQDASGTNLFVVRGNGKTELSTFVYGNTVASPRTLFIASNGELGGISSLRESKTNIQQFDTSWLMKLNPVSFNYRKKDEDGKYTNENYNELFYGLIAEETELVNKEICIYNDNKLVGIEYSKLVPALLKAVQELQEQINELKNK